MPQRHARRARGFTLTELAIVLAIVGLLLGSLMYTLSAQTEQRNFEDTRRRLELARELVLAYAVVNGRLPCPARSAATASPVTVTGEEVRDASGNCAGDSVTDYYGGASGSVTLGLLPARTIGYQQVNSDGFALDAWQNRIRYVVSGATPVNSQAPRICRPVSDATPPDTPHFTNSTYLRKNGIDCQPSDLLVCKSATGITSTACGSSANQIMTQNLVVAIIYSTGKNFSTAQDAATATAAGRLDEAANLNGNRVFVYHTPTPSTAANGEFDDQFTWITVGELYGKLIAAGVLP